MSIPLVMVGGFLGVGKTTLLWQAARALTAHGLRVGLVTNDQAPDLVDTGLLLNQGLDVREVSGGCFSCSFPEFLDAAGVLKNRLHVDIVLAEPVGTCADLAASVFQPIQDRHAREFRLARHSVLTDPTRVEAALGGSANDLHPSAAYLVRKQLEEADVIVLNKVDLLSAEAASGLHTRVQAAFPQADVRLVSALNGRGVDSWLASTQDSAPAGRRILEIDYDTYAEGAAAFGWLNADVALAASRGPADWRRFCETLMGTLRDGLLRRGTAVGHLKVLLSADGEALSASLSHGRADVSLRGGVAASPSADLTLNARVELPPNDLESIVRAALATAAGNDVRARVRTLRCLRPPRPSPTHRYAAAL